MKIESFYKTLIIMYYDIYTGKMIPGIFICLDNKTLEGYKFIFTIFKNYIINIIKKKNIRIEWETLSMDKEILLYNSFLLVFDKNFCLYNHILCYFHYMEDIRRFCQKNGYTDNKHERD